MIPAENRVSGLVRRAATLRAMLTRPADHLGSDHYEQLVRFAFLLLDGRSPEGSVSENRLARAYRIAGKAVRRYARRSALVSDGDAGPYHLARRRVLRHILRHERTPRPARLAPSARVVLPEPPPEATELREVLGELSAPARAAYLLVVLDGLAEQAARAEIAAVTGGRWEHRIMASADDGSRVDASAALTRVAATSGLDRSRQCALLTGGDLDPSSPRMLPRFARPRYVPRPERRKFIPAVAVVVVALLAVALLLYPGYLVREDAPWDDAVVITQDEWEPGDAGWPIAGDRRGDADLQRAAAKAWYTRAAGDTGLVVSESSPTHWWPRGGGNPDEVGVLFAGDVDETPTVLLYARGWGTASGSDGVVARYEGSDGRHDDPLLIVTAVKGLFQNATMLPLTSDNQSGDPDRSGSAPSGVRFLAPPGLAELHKTPVGPRPADWEEVPVSARVTGRVDVRDRGGEYRPPVCPAQDVLLRADYEHGQHPATRHYLYRPPEHAATPKYPAEVEYDSGTGRSGSGDDGDDELASVRMRSALRTLGCDDHLDRHQQLSSLRFTESWHGELPEDGPDAALLRLRAPYVAAPRGEQQPELGLLVADEPSAYYYRDGEQARDHSSDGASPKTTFLAEGESDDAVMAAWWQTSPAESGRWYLLIAGEKKRIDRITVSGDMEREIEGRSALVRGPRAKGSADVPSVRVNATGESSGDQLPHEYAVTPRG